MMEQPSALAVAPRPVDENVVDELMEFFDVTEFGGRNYQTLSGGERQRVNFARVLAQLWRGDSGASHVTDSPATQTSCRYLFLDEPYHFSHTSSNRVHEEGARLHQRAGRCYSRGGSRPESRRALRRPDSPAQSRARRRVGHGRRSAHGRTHTRRVRRRAHIRPSVTRRCARGPGLPRSRWN